MAEKEAFRVEKDSMGEMNVPKDAYYAAQTQRAFENFPISGQQIPAEMIASLGQVKLAACRANKSLGLLDAKKFEYIEAAASEVVDGKFNSQFIVDIYQTGSGTSSNMNANEVISSRAKELAKGETSVHPNDDVNMCQSSNDVFPTSIHVATAVAITKILIPGLTVLKESLNKKSVEFSKLLKTGRTHLQDATPITLGQEFSGYERQIEQSIWRVQRSLTSIFELPLGGTAVGTGINTHPEFAKIAIQEINKQTGLPFFEAMNHFEAQGAKDALVEIHGQLKTIAISLTKVANDIRWLGTGPRCGLGEINLPSIQPGSSIMPGKVNPVIPESVLMVCAKVIGNDATVSYGGALGSSFELNVMMPVIGHCVIESVNLLGKAASNFASKCIDGIEPNKERLHDLAEASIATCTALVPRLGYDKSAELAKKAFKTGKSLRSVAEAESGLDKEELDKLLDLMSMTEPGL